MHLWVIEVDHLGGELSALEVGPQVCAELEEPVYFFLVLMHPCVGELRLPLVGDRRQHCAEPFMVGGGVVVGLDVVLGVDAGIIQAVGDLEDVVDVDCYDEVFGSGRGFIW